MRKSLILIILGLSFSLVCGFAEEPKSNTIKLVPLAEKTTEVLKENPDKTEVGYVGIRCSVLYSLLGGMNKMKFTGNNAEGRQKTALSLDEKANIFRTLGILFSKKFNDYTDEDIVKQNKIILEEYAAEMNRNKLLNNSRFSDFILSDIEAAKSVFPFYETVYEAMKGEKPEDTKKP